MTSRRPYQDQILGHLMLAATSAHFPASLFPKRLSVHLHPMVRGATGVSPPSASCSSPTVPGGCYGTMCGRTPGTMIEPRPARIGPFPKLPPLCLTTRPPASHHCTWLPGPSQNSCRSWSWLQQPQIHCGDHGAVPYMRTKPGSKETLSAQPCLATGTRTRRCPGARAMLCWKEPSQGSQQALPQHLRAREVSCERRERKFRLTPLQPFDRFPGSS